MKNIIHEFFGTPEETGLAERDYTLAERGMSWMGVGVVAAVVGFGLGTGSGVVERFGDRLSTASLAPILLGLTALGAVVQKLK